MFGLRSLKAARRASETFSRRKERISVRRAGGEEEEEEVEEVEEEEETVVEISVWTMTRDKRTVWT